MSETPASVSTDLPSGRPAYLPQRPLRVLSLTTMFPSQALPVHAVFVRNRLQAAAAHADFRVISPVPVFPVATRVMDRYKTRLDIPRHQIHRAGAMGPALSAHYPHFLSVPGFAKPLDGVALAEALMREMRRLRREEGFVPDIIDAHLAFPDGFAGALVAKKTGLPLAITLRGHDINDLPRFPVRWQQVRYALKAADRVIGVCRALVDGAIDAGMAPEKGVAIANGVDPTRFAPVDKAEARAALGLPQGVPLVVSVGHMVERKGFHILVEALNLLKGRGRDDVHMVFVGGAGEEGDFVAQVKGRVAEAGLTGRVHFAGAVANHLLPQYYSAADVFALATAKEGWPNVLFESLACGTPPVITEVWGTPECLCRPELGVLVKERTGEAFAEALDQALSTEWDTDLLVRYARANTWATVGRRTVTELERAVALKAGIDAARLDDDLGPPPVGPMLPEGL